jgi:hypothetical protein
MQCLLGCGKNRQQLEPCLRFVRNRNYKDGHIAAAVTCCSAHITTLAATPLPAFAAPVAAYAAPAGQTAPNWDALRVGSSTLYTAFKAAVDAIWVPTPAGDFASTVFTGSAAGSAANFNTQSASVKAAGAAVTPALLTAADLYATAAAGQSLPDVTALTTNLDTMVATFAPFGTPYSTVSKLQNFY